MLVADGGEHLPPVFNELPEGESYDLIWAHPPYWRQKLYTENQGHLSRRQTLNDFLSSYRSFIQNCVGRLSPNGKLVVLMGDYIDRQAGFVPLTHYTKRIALAEGLRQSCTDIIRFSYGLSSSHNVYHSSFIPGLHDVCTTFERVAE